MMNKRKFLLEEKHVYNFLKDDFKSLLNNPSSFLCEDHIHHYFRNMKILNNFTHEPLHFFRQYTEFTNRILVKTDQLRKVNLPKLVEIVKGDIPPPIN